MKKIVLASAAMGGAALVAFGASGTFAAFTDNVQSSTQTAQAGSLTFGSINQTVSSGTLDVGNLTPGQSFSYVTYIDNAGSLPGNLSGVVTVIENDDNGCTGAEGRAGDTSCGDFEGEFAATADVTARYLTVGGQSECSDALVAPLFASGKMLVLNNNRQDAGRVEADQGGCVVVTVSLPREAGNEVQSDSAAIRYDLTLAQI